MKAVILAGGLGTRLSEETVMKPKPMVEVGDKPILWHVMKLYSAHGIKEFVICLGYRGYMIKEYFANYFLHNSNVTFDLVENQMEIHNSQSEPWKVTLVDTGHSSMTGGRVKRIAPHIDGTFLLTYGDGVGNINITQSIDFHKTHKKLATMTVVQPMGRFGAVERNPEGQVTHFQEKPMGDGGWINGGFFVLEPEVFNYIKDDSTIWEQDPMKNLSRDGQLFAYEHKGFWQPMDTLRDKTYLDKLWQEGEAPWKIW